ncbi:GntR family transcriptional regulator [Mucilaginibacter daejeonensis]|uniref:GntR family transcriptional regulator n=1 Tax=Mucilaginibacter daejeonensis TaxID=398049 RepID=UPI001D17BBB7|nr:GntR family transcriptional regulator [Mucilaginibacter daejeonensis]UEG54992.1 GntR family transcriptional regulator [Mucilaginibacter daejeonensis]
MYTNSTYLTERPAKRAPSFSGVIDLNKIKINVKSAVPISSQLAQQLQKLIENASFDRSQPLPSLNTLSKLLGIAPSTAFRAYNQLNSHNLVVWIKGSGFFAKR